MVHPFLSLLGEVLNLTHPRFALANGSQYSPAEAVEPAASHKVRERSFLFELYHEFRRLWDRAVPVQRGLGHVVIQADSEAGSRTPDLLFWQLGEHGSPDRRMAAVSVAYLSNPDAVVADQTVLARFHKSPGYPLALSVVVGRRAELPPIGISPPEGVTMLFFDIDKWQAVFEGNT